MSTKINDIAVSINQVPSPSVMGRVCDERQISMAQDSKNADSALLQAEELKVSAEEINKTLEALSHALRFKINNDFNQLQVQIVDVESNKVLKEIPPEDMLELSAKIKEMARMFQKMVGLIVDEYV